MLDQPESTRHAWLHRAIAAILVTAAMTTTLIAYLNGQYSPRAKVKMRVTART